MELVYFPYIHAEPDFIVMSFKTDFGTETDFEPIEKFLNEKSINFKRISNRVFVPKDEWNIICTYFS